MTTRWSWKGTDYPFDITDADCIARVSRAVETLNARLDARQGSRESAQPDSGPLGRLSADAAEYCGLVDLFFGILFGEGTPGVLFGGNRSMAEHGAAYASFLAFAAEQLDALELARREAQERYGSLADRLSPEEA